MASPSSNDGGKNENTQGEGSNKNAQSTNESGHLHDTKANYIVNNNTFGYQPQDPGMKLNNTNTQWGNYPGQQHFGAMPGIGGTGTGTGTGAGEGYGGQDEASFVQNFAVQQQPIFFGGYPYYGGFSPFANPLYSQLGYLGQPFVDPQSFMALNNGQNLLGIPPDGLTGNMAGERSADHQDGSVMPGGDLLMNMPGMENLYSLYQHQLGNAFANLSIQDVQDQQRLLQQQLYHQQLLQLQQQQLQQQLHQQLLLQSQLAAQVEAGDNSTPPQDSQPTLGLISNTQQTSNQVTDQEVQQYSKQAEAEVHSEPSKPKEQSEGQQMDATSEDQKQKHDGPRSWADVLAAKKNASTNPTPTVSTSTNANPTPTHASTNASTTAAAVATLSPTSGAMVPVKPTHTHKSEDASRHNKQPPLKIHDKYNPTHFDYNVASARFFVIKSYSEDDIHKAIKYNIWASTDSGNRRLDTAFRESSSAGPIYLFFSVNASGQFCGMARMTTALDYGKKSDLWAQDKWNGQFGLHWIFIKDIPNAHLRHIRLINNENKPVTNSRDTQEIFLEPGKEVLRIFTTYVSKTSILDDFSFYDKRQEIMKEKKQIEGDTGDEGNKPDNNGELPVATGESRKQRTTPVGSKVASPPQGHQPPSINNANKSNSPQQPYAKSLNGPSPKTVPTQQQRASGSGSGSGSGSSGSGSGAKKK